MRSENKHSIGCKISHSITDSKFSSSSVRAVDDNAEKSVPAPGQLPVLDEDVLADLRDSGGGSDGLIKRVFGLFSDNAPESFSDIQKVSQTSDKVALADAAHALKSMCANIGAAKAAAACHVLELAARQGEDIDVGAAIAEISATMNEALGQIRQLQA